MPQAYYLKLGSGRSQFPGNSSEPHHVGWIELISMSWGRTDIRGRQHPRN